MVRPGWRTFVRETLQSLGGVVSTCLGSLCLVVRDAFSCCAGRFLPPTTLKYCLLACRVLADAEGAKRAFAFTTGMAALAVVTNLTAAGVVPSSERLSVKTPLLFCRLNSLHQLVFSRLVITPHKTSKKQQATDRTNDTAMCQSPNVNFFSFPICAVHIKSVDKGFDASICLWFRGRDRCG